MAPLYEFERDGGSCDAAREAGHVNQLERTAHTYLSIVVQAHVTLSYPPDRKFRRVSNDYTKGPTEASDLTVTQVVTVPLLDPLLLINPIAVKKKKEEKDII